MSDVSDVREDIERLYKSLETIARHSNTLEQRVQELEARIEATGRVLFRLISYNQCFREELLDHLYGKKVSRKELIDRANSVEEYHRNKGYYYHGFELAIKAEMQGAEVLGNEL